MEGALDTSLTKFHKLKSEEINRVIKDLWVFTYAGTDIDCIEVRSDADEGGGDTGDAEVIARKSYNYRIVMSKGGTELDMRGRCSAGQKVLASIVIRLALAESFCSSGLVALDEPSASLDLENRLNLARCVGRLIDMHKDEANFQVRGGGGGWGGCLRCMR